MRRVYLDYAATTPMRPEVAEAMSAYFTESFGNPSAIYSYGQEAKGAVENARSQTAKLLGAREEEIVFTSGGTEADNIALQGVAYAADGKGNQIITNVLEHHAVLETCEFLEKKGCKVTYLKVDKFGMVNPDDVKRAITKDTILISIMHANNEIGTIQPIADIGKIAKEAGIYFHTDAVQSTGHIPIDVNTLGVDLLAISAHKLNGPKGVGALYVRKGTRLFPLLHGGGQEKRLRPGTENVPGIVGLGMAAELAQAEIDSETSRLTALRDKLIGRLTGEIENVHLNGHPSQRLPNNINVSIEYIEGESIILNLDLEGICASTGSACSSGSLEPSHVLLGCGVPHEQAHGSVRFTMGKWTQDEDIDRVMKVLPGVVSRLRAMSPLLRMKR